eukprot:g653.t1
MSGWFDKAKAWTSDAASRASEAASKTLEKTKEASQKAKEIAKQKLGRMETAAELTKQLEEKARGASTLTQIAELHRSWIGMMNRKDGGPMYVLAINAETGEEIIPTEVSGELDVLGGGTAPGTAGGAPSAGSSKDVLVLEEVEGGESTVSTDVASGGETGGGAAGTASSGSSSKKKGIFGKISSVVSRKSGSAVEDAKADPNRRLLWLTGGAALQTPARKDCAKTKGDVKHKTPATEPRTGSGNRKPRGKGKNKSFMPLTKFSRCAYAMMKLAWMKKSKGQAEPNATKKKTKLLSHETSGNGVSIPPPAMKFLQQITEAYVVDQIQTGRKIRERVKAGKTMAADLIGEGEAKNFVLDNSKEDGCAALLDVSSDSDDSSSDDAASDLEMELEKDKPESDAIDDEIFETKVRGKSFASMLNAAVVEHNIKHADLFDQLDFMGDEKATQSAPTDQSEKYT